MSSDADQRPRSPALAAATLAALLLASCAERSIVPQPAAVLYPAPNDELDFIDALRAQPIVSVHDALHALLISAGELPQTRSDTTADADPADPADPADTSWQRVRERAEQLGWIAPGIELDPRSSVRAGLVASVILRITPVPRGLALRVFIDEPWTPESYPLGQAAVRALRLRGMMPERSANQTLRGAELIDILRAAEAISATDD